METWHKWLAGGGIAVVLIVVIYFAWKWWKKPAE